jgi:hypothetical protein
MGSAARRRRIRDATPFTIHNINLLNFYFDFIRFFRSITTELTVSILLG